MVLLFLVKLNWSWCKKKHSIFVVHLNGQVFCVSLLFIFSLLVFCSLLLWMLWCHAMLKCKKMFNQFIKPREFPSFNSETIHFLFCNNSIVPPTPLRYNHYAPLIFCSEKNKVNKKSKLVTSQKCKKGSTKLATYSINHFWKQDLSVFPNFACDLNVHKSPSVSKFQLLI